MTEHTIIDLAFINSKGISYNEYYSSIENFVTEKTTSGNDITEERIEITKLNLHRMKRLNEAELNLDILNLHSSISVAIITEAWCGDSAQNIPWVEHFINKCSPKISSYYFYRDENPKLMNQFLTNGSRSIPKCIFFDSATGNVLDTWGPRPEEIKNWLQQLRTEHPDMPKHDWEIELHKYYSKNKGAAIIADLKAIISRLI